MERIESTYQHQSDPTLKEILHKGLTNFHNQQTGVAARDYDPKYQGLISQQNDLGWDQLYRGRWSTQWCLLHDQYVQQYYQDLTAVFPDGETWVFQHGIILMDQWLKLWQIRNEERHGKDTNEKQQKRASTLTRQLQDIYTFRSQVIPRDRSLFYATPEEHMAARPNLDQLEDWILTHRNAIQASATQAKKLGLTRIRTIQDYFQPQHNPERETLGRRGMPH
jgi:hypothetical protein